jgi:hypothetical protein
VRSQASSERGQPAQWTVSAWTTGGNIPDAIIRLQATHGSGKPEFSFGCGTYDGTSSCDLGAVDAKSAERQLQAQLTVPVTASTITSATLTVIGSAAYLPKDPKAYATVTITPSPAPEIVTSPLPVGSLPGIPAASPTLSPGGNAAGLFPTLEPSPTPSSTQKASTRPVANTSALPEGASVVGAQLLGLAALGLAFVLAVTRLSIRRPLAPASPAAGSAEPPAKAPAADPGAPAADPEPSGSAQEPATDTSDEPGDGEPDA